MVYQLERALANWSGRAYALVTNSGTSALRACLYALNLKPSALVAVQAYNYPPVVHSVASFGFRPVLLDVDPETLVLMPDELKWALTLGVDAVVVTHMWGWVGYCHDIANLCRQAGVPLVEDGSRAYGAQVKDKHAGQFGDLAFFSMNDSKVLNAGEGGFLVTDDYSLAARAASLGLPLHHLRNGTTMGGELGYGEKHTIHPAGLKTALEVLPNLQKRILASQKRFQRLTRELHKVKIVLGNGLRGAWKDVAFHDDIKALSKHHTRRVHNEFSTNDITTWAPRKWLAGRSKFSGAYEGRLLKVLEDICGYNP